jgi:uncharacterized surface protein with fasciclin (FAS1) repeats
MKILTQVFILLAIVAAAGFATGQPEDVPQEEPMEEMEPTVVDIAVNDGRFETLVTALEAADLVETLQGEGPFTVFAPTDDAFAELPDGTLESLLADIPTLTSILTYHVVAGQVGSEQVVELSSAETLQGQPVVITSGDSGVMVNDANVVITDIEGSNGVIHVIDSVIMPPTEDIVETAINAGSFETLVTAVQAAGLVETLQGEGPFTVFAPTDEAFAALPDGTVESLLDDTDQLASILTYHVVPGRVFSGDVVGIDEAPTVQGSSIDVSVDMGSVMLNDSATVVQTDILTTNGVIHVIDQVILPPEN